MQLENTRKVKLEKRRCKIKKTSGILVAALIILLCLIVFSLNNREHSLSKYFEENCDFKKVDDCIIDLQGFVNCKIDCVFVFYPNISGKEKSQAIGIKYKNNDEITDERRRVIIVGKNKVLFEHNYWNDEFDFQGGRLVEFSNAKRLNNPYCVFKNSEFEVTKSKDSRHYFFLCSQLYQNQTNTPEIRSSSSSSQNKKP